MALEFLDGYNSIVTIYWTLIVDTVVNRMQVMLVKEEEISDILCRTLPLCCDLQVRLCHFPDVPASNRMGFLAA